MHTDTRAMHYGRPLALAGFQVGQSSVALRCTGGMPAARSLHHVPTLSSQQLPLHRMSHRGTTLSLGIFSYYTKLCTMHCNGKRRIEYSIGAADTC